MSLLSRTATIAGVACVVGLAVLLCAASGLAGQAAARPAKGASVRVLVAYFSRTGHTEAMARAVADGARSVPGATVVLKTVADVTRDDLLGADAILVGTPVYNGGASSEVKEFMERWPFGVLKDKVGAAFCTSAGISAGQESALLDLVRSMLVFQFVVVGGDTWQAAFGASAVTEEGKAKAQQGVDEAAKAKAKGLGARAASVAQRLKVSAREADAAAAQTKPATATVSREADIATSLSAAPPAVAEQAAVVDMDDRGKMTVLRPGTNGWTCLPRDPGTPVPYPVCLDKNGLAWFAAAMAGKEPDPATVGYSYMLQGGTTWSKGAVGVGAVFRDYNFEFQKRTSGKPLRPLLSPYCLLLSATVCAARAVEGDAHGAGSRGGATRP